MTTPSNRYAEAIFAEQPIALWSLDDTISPGIISALGDIAIGQTHGTVATSYGFSTYPGYYLADDSNNSFAKNANIPMVFGASSITTISENLDGIDNKPSIILPGFGFLNNVGRYKTLTFEMWLRIQSSSRSPRKIFGPIASDDGLYVNDSFLVLKINDNIASHYVGQWGRPMLIDVTVAKNIAIMLVNGEQVISMDIDSASLNLPDQTGIDGDQDWVGFYAYDDVSPIDIDCIAVYPTKVSSVVATRRFSYGEAVEAPEITNAAYTDVPIMIDYTVSKYANNKIFPNPERWDQPVMDNISAQNNLLKVPSHTLPSVIFQDTTKTLSDWYSLNLSLQGEDSYYIPGLLNPNTFFQMNPDTWSSAGHIFFDRFNLLTENVDAFYGVFSISEYVDGTATLIKLINDFNQYVEVVITGDGSSSKIEYHTNISGSDANIVDGQILSLNTDFVVGLNIQDFASEYPELSTFFANRNTLKAYCLSNETFSQAFDGKAYRIGFMNGRNLSQVLGYFSSGIADQAYVSDLKDHFASYTLIASNTFNSFTLDIAVNSYWETYFPLTTFAKNVKNASGQLEYDLDFIQFNIDYPDSYIVDESDIDTTGAYVKTYVNFFDLSTDITQNSNIPEYTKTPLSSSRVIEPDSSWTYDLYEVVNDSIIYPPNNETFETLGIKIIVELNVPGILRNPVAIRSLELASVALNYAEPTLVGTKYGKDIYANNDAGYKEKNPYLIYKSSSPYIYLNNSSGIRLTGSQATNGRSIIIPINDMGAEYYKVSLVQASIFSNDLFPDTPTEVLRITYFTPEEKELRLMATRATGDASGKTAELYVVDKLGNPDYNVVVAINGISATDGADSDSNLDNMVIGYREWVMVGIKIPNLLDYSNLHTGKIEVTGKILVNNIADYQITPADEGSRIFYRTWSGVSDYGTWGDLITDFASWLDLEVEKSFAVPGVNASETFNTYFGNNRIVIGDDTTPVRFNQAQYTVFKNIIWKTSTITPV